MQGGMNDLREPTMFWLDLKPAPEDTNMASTHSSQ